VGGTDVGSDDSAVSPDPLSEASRTLEQCTAEKKAWILVPVPAVCGEPLVAWCCTKDEIFRHFPQQEGKLKDLFIDAEKDGSKLYHCSSNADTKRTTFHFGRVGGTPALVHRTVFTTSIPFDVPASGGACPVVTTNDLKVN